MSKSDQSIIETHTRTHTTPPNTHTHSNTHTHTHTDTRAHAHTHAHTAELGFVAALVRVAPLLVGVGSVILVHLPHDNIRASTHALAADVDAQVGA